MSSFAIILRRLQELTSKKVGLLALFRKKVEDAELQAVREEILNSSSETVDKL